MRTTGITNNTSTNRRARRSRRWLGAAALGVAISAVSPGAAHAQSDAAVNDMERATLLARPSLVYLETEYVAWMTAPNGYRFFGGNAYTLRNRCSGFVVNGDGYVVTAGHCVDPEMIQDDLVELGLREGVAKGWIKPGSIAQWRELGRREWALSGASAGSGPGTKTTVKFGVAVEGLPSGSSSTARLVDVAGIDEGDVALLKVEADDLPATQLAKSERITVGTPVLSLGYPGASDRVTDATYEPTVRDGYVAAKKTRSDGKLPVWEITAALQPGMSGGPTVDRDGNVIGVNSFRSGANEADAFISPVTLVREMLGRAGVGNELSTVDKTYRQGVEAMALGDYAAAVAAFDRTLDRRPSHQQANELRSRAVELLEVERAAGATAPSATPVVASSDGASELPLDAIAGGAGTIGAAAAAVVLAGRRRRQMSELRRELLDLRSRTEPANVPDAVAHS